jgi:hypothetical protein
MIPSSSGLHSAVGKFDRLSNSGLYSVWGTGLGDRGTIYSAFRSPFVDIDQHTIQSRNCSRYSRIER